MQLFLFTLLYFVVVFIGIVFCMYIYNLIPKIKKHKNQIDEIERKLYKELRDLQLKSKILAQAISKLLKQKKSIIIEAMSFLLLNLLPFKKLKNGLLIYRLIKKIAQQ